MTFTNSTNGSLTGDTGAGIFAGEGSVVKDCSVGLNKGDGIVVENATVVSGNDCNGNGLGSDVGSGIRVTGNGARIQNSNVSSNDTGIRVTGTGTLIEANHVRNHPGPGIQVTTTANGKNVIIRNVAGDNVNSYSGLAGGNQVGPIDSNFTSTSPFANLQN